MGDVLIRVQNNRAVIAPFGASVIAPLVSAATTAAAAAAASASAANDDAVQTAADRVQTGLDATATAADRVQTGLDAVATAADRVQTGLDAAAAAGSAADAVAAMTQAELAAIAAGAAIYTSVANGEAGTSDGDLFYVSTAAGVQVYENQSGTGVAIGFLGTVSFPNVAALKAFTGPLTPVGTRIHAGRFRYEVVSSGEHLTTDGSQKLIVLPGEDGYDLEAFGADMTGSASVNTILAAADTAAQAADTAIVLQGGTVLVNANLTVTADVTVKRGGKFSVSSGTLTLNGNFKAGRYSIFSGAGTGPAFGAGSVDAIFPEWFGAKARASSGVSPFNSSPGILAALTCASRSTLGFAYRVLLAQGIYDMATAITFPSAGLVHLEGQGLGTQVRGMDGGSGFPNDLFIFVSSTTESRIRKIYFYSGSSSRPVNYAIRANTEMKHTHVTECYFSSFAIAGISSADWDNLLFANEFTFCGVGIWLQGGSNNNDISVNTCRFISCDVSLITGPGANIRARDCQFQGALASPYTKTFAYCYGGSCITFDNCYFETQSSGGGLAGMAFTSPEAVRVFAAVIFNDTPYYTDTSGTVTTTLARNASTSGRSTAAFRECLFSTPAYYAAGAGGSGYTAGAVTITKVNGTGTGASGTASVSGGAISNVTSITGGTGWQTGDEVIFDQGGNTTARGRVLSTTTNNAIASISIGGAAAIYPGNCQTLTIDNCSWPSSGALFCLYNDTAYCEPGRVQVTQPNAYGVNTREFFLLGSNINTIKAPLRDFKIDAMGRTISNLTHGIVNYYPSTFNFTPTVSTFLRQASRYQSLPSYRLTLNASQQTSDAITGSMTIGSSGGVNAELVGRRVYLAVRKSESAANVKLRLTLSLTNGTSTITTQNYDSSTSFTKSTSLGWEEVSIAIPTNGGTLSWTIEVIAATAASQFVEIIGLPILSLAGVPVEDFPRWLFERPLEGSATYDPPSLADGATATTTITVNGARGGAGRRRGSGTPRGSFLNARG